MTIRVTVGSAQAGSLAGLQAASARWSMLQQQLSTGNQITNPSDDPAGTVRALTLRGDLKLNSQYARNQTDATAWLTAADTAYGQITDLVQKVRTLTVQASNTGSSTGQSAAAIGEQIDALREAIFKLANTTYNGRPIFGGTTAGETAFSMANDGTVSYVGDSGTVHRSIGDKNDVKISQTGSEAFKPNAAGDDLFALLAKIVTNLTTGTDTYAAHPGGDAGDPTGTPSVPPSATYLADPLADLDAALGSLTSARAASGAALARVEAAQATGATDKLTIRTALSEIQDIDIAEVAVEMNTAKVVYEAALQTTANIQQLSLLNFLR